MPEWPEQQIGTAKYGGQGQTLFVGQLVNELRHGRSKTHEISESAVSMGTTCCYRGSPQALLYGNSKKATPYSIFPLCREIHASLTAPRSRLRERWNTARLSSHTPNAKPALTRAAPNNINPPHSNRTTTSTTMRSRGAMFHKCWH